MESFIDSDRELLKGVEVNALLTINHFYLGSNSILGLGESYWTYGNWAMGIIFKLVRGCATYSKQNPSLNLLEWIDSSQVIRKFCPFKERRPACLDISRNLGKRNGWGMWGFFLTNFLNHGQPLSREGLPFVDVRLFGGKFTSKELFKWNGFLLSLYGTGIRYETTGLFEIRMIGALLYL